MTDFVRICPKCGHSNPEYENACSACNQFIGMEAAVPRSASTEPPIAEEKTTEEKIPPAEPVSPTLRFPSQELAFYLEHQGSGQVFTIKPGWLVGQAHPSNEAEIQIPQEIEGSEFILRRHCRFDYTEGCWTVTALAQTRYGQDFTNPSFLNERALPSDQPQALHNGDILRLSGVSFSIKFI